jgi:hypothetical protein
MKKTLVNKLSTIRNKVMELVDDLNDRKDELQDRDDPEGKWEEEINQIDELVEVLEQFDWDTCNFDE